jgi:hypothetical protein
MAFSYSSNASDIMAQLQKVMGYVIDEAAEYERQIVIQLNARILALTPVWEGDSIANYHWSVNSPLMDHREPEGTGYPGPTNSMPLGAEPRRAANEAFVREDLQKVLAATLPADIYLTNTAPDIINLEYGQNPSPQTTRAPHGMIRLAIAEVVGSLHGT